MGTVECDACVTRSNGLYGAVGASIGRYGVRDGGKEGGRERERERPRKKILSIPYQKYLARSCQDVSRFGKLARNLFQIHANFSNLQESFLSCKILVSNPCENLVLLDFWPDSCKILKRSCQDSFQDLGKIFS